MKGFVALLLFLALLPVSPFARAEEDDDVYPPVGMEVIKVGDADVLVPAGTKIRKRGDVNVIEDISEYTSRQFVAMEKRFERLETKHGRLAKEVKEGFKGVEARLEDIEEALLMIKQDLANVAKETDKEP